jgi:hypothetical protein
VVNGCVTRRNLPNSLGQILNKEKLKSRDTWLYSRYVDNPNKIKKFKLQEKNFKLEKLKFDYQIRCLSTKLKIQVSC